MSSEQEATKTGQGENGSYNTYGAKDTQQGSETRDVSPEVQEILQKLGSAAQRSIDLSFIDMEEDEAQLIGKAIASSQTLEELTLQLDSMCQGDLVDENPPRSNDTILSTALLGSRPNSSVRTLIIAGSGTDGDLMNLGVVPRVILENSHLTKLEFQWRGDDGTSREQTQELFDSLLQNSTLQTLVLPSLVRWDFEGSSDDQGFIDAETFSQIVKLVQQNASIHHLDLPIGECRGPGSEELNLPAFYTALRSNSTIKSLHLRSNFITRDAEGEFLKWIETTSTLEELHLDPLDDYYYDEDDVEFPLRYNLLFKSLQRNKSLKKLVLEGSSVDPEDNFRELLDAIKINSRLQEITFDPQNVSKGQAVREALQGRVDAE